MVMMVLLRSYLYIAISILLGQRSSQRHQQCFYTTVKNLLPSFQSKGEQVRFNQTLLEGTLQIQGGEEGGRACTCTWSRVRHVSTGWTMASDTKPAERWRWIELVNNNNQLDLHFFDFSQWKGQCLQLRRTEDGCKRTPWGFALPTTAPC